MPSETLKPLSLHASFKIFMNQRVTQNLLESDWPGFFIFDHQANVVRFHIATLTANNTWSDRSSQVRHRWRLDQFFEWFWWKVQRKICQLIAMIKRGICLKSLGTAIICAATVLTAYIAWLWWKPVLTLAERKNCGVPISGLSKMSC